MCRYRALAYSDLLHIDLYVVFDTYATELDSNSCLLLCLTYASVFFCLYLGSGAYFYHIDLSLGILTKRHLLIIDKNGQFSDINIYISHFTVPNVYVVITVTYDQSLFFKNT